MSTESSKLLVNARLCQALRLCQGHAGTVVGRAMRIVICLFVKSASYINVEQDQKHGRYDRFQKLEEGTAWMSYPA